MSDKLFTFHPAKERSSNILKLLQSRENGFHDSCSTPSDVFSMQTNLRHTKTFTTTINGLPVKKCDYIKTGWENGYILGAWHSYRYPTVLYKLKLSLRSKYSKYNNSSIVEHVEVSNPQVVNEYFTDSCFYKMSSEVSVMFSNGTPSNEIAYISRDDVRKSGSEIVFSSLESDALELDVKFHVPDELSCCAYSLSTETFVAGAEKKLYLYDKMYNRMTSVIPGKPEVLEFDETGTLYMCDLTFGLRVHDMRVPSVPGNDSIIVPRNVYEMKLLPKENSIVLHKGKEIILVDLRALKILHTYKLPKPEYPVVKNPFSINESLGLLCSTNRENVTRLWSLESGKELCTIKCNKPFINVKSCLLTNENQWGVGIFSEDNLLIFEP